MGRNFVDTNPDHIDYSGTPPVSAAPLTFSCWAKSATGSGIVRGQIAISNQGGNRWALFWDNNDKLNFTNNDNASNNTAQCAAAHANNTWQHVAGVAYSNTSVAAFQAGVKATASGSNPTVSGLNYTRIGGWNSGGNAFPFRGDLKDIAVWDIDLLDAEITSLAGGADPRTIQPSHLVAYWPVPGTFSPEVDITGNGRHLTLQGTTKSATDPTVTNSGFLPVNHVQAGTSDASNVTTGAIDTTGAKLITLAITANSVTYTVSDSKGNTWTALTARGSGLERLYYCINPTVGSGHTFSVASTAQLPTISVLAFSSVNTPSLDTETGASAAGSTEQPGSITPASVAEVFVTGYGYADTGVATVNSGFATGDTPVGLAGGLHYGTGTAFRINFPADSTARNPTWTQGSSTAQAVAMAAFKLSTTYTSTLSATQGQTSTLPKQASSVRTATNAQAATIPTRQTAAKRTATQGQTATFGPKAITAKRSATQGQTATTVKQTAHLFPRATQAQTATLRRSAGAIKLAQQGQLATLSESEAANPFSVKVNGVNLTAYLKDPGGINHNDVINGRSMLTLVFEDPNNILEAQLATGMEVLFHDTDGVLVFGGTIEDPELELLGDKTMDAAELQVQVVGFDQLADKRLIGTAYAAGTDIDIFNDIIDHYLVDDDVIGDATGGSAVSLPEMSINYTSAAALLDELCKLTGKQWFMGPNRVLFYGYQTAFAAPWSITDAAYNCISIRKRRSRSTYRNVQYITGGVDQTSLQTEAWKGDGSKITFTTGYPLAKVPTVVTVNGVAKTIGIRSVETGKDWYWNEGSNEITQDSAGVVLISTDTLAVQYYGQFPIIEGVQNDTEISARQAVEGGTGRYEALDNRPEITSSALALAYANATMARDGAIDTILTIVTQKSGLRAGMQLTVNVTKENINGIFTITAVDASDLFMDLMEYTITAVSGSTLNGWQNFFKTMLAQQGPPGVNSSIVSAVRTITAAAVATDGGVSVSTGGPESRAGYAVVGYSEAG